MPTRRSRSSTRKVTVPDFSILTFSDAESYLTSRGIQYTYQSESTSTQSYNNTVFYQSYLYGSTYLYGSEQFVFKYYTYVAPPFFPPFFPFFPPAFPYFPVFDPVPPFFPFFPPAFPFFPFFPPAFPFFPFFPPAFPFFPFFPFFPPAFGPYFTRCVDGDTMILTTDGLKQARDIQIGDSLLTVDSESLMLENNIMPLNIKVDDLKLKNLVKTTVTNIISSNKLDRVYFNNNEKAQFTETHPIFIKRKNEYLIVESGTVKKGDILIKINIELLGPDLDMSKIISEILVEKINKKTLDVAKDVYTFSCDPYNWYFAGNILTHNK